jgi:hypothetical protein
MIDNVMKDPAMPIFWGKNQKGMQAVEELVGADLACSKDIWLAARDQAVDYVRDLNDFNLHKQIANRLLEPWMWITVICTATEFGNFFNLRNHKDAQPEFQKLAKMMAFEYHNSLPEERHLHAPLLFPEDWAGERITVEEMKKVSVGRCARVSYLTHDGKRDLQADIDLHDRLCQSGHWSPFEHVAELAEDPRARSGNFTGWVQYRKEFSNENREQYLYIPDEVYL